jgi:hypothetical protein
MMPSYDTATPSEVVARYGNLPAHGVLAQYLPHTPHLLISAKLMTSSRNKRHTSRITLTSFISMSVVSAAECSARLPVMSVLEGADCLARRWGSSVIEGLSKAFFQVRLGRFQVVAPCKRKTIWRIRLGHLPGYRGTDHAGVAL